MKKAINIVSALCTFGGILFLATPVIGILFKDPGPTKESVQSLALVATAFFLGGIASKLHTK